jgi:hypothetical protein
MPLSTETTLGADTAFAEAFWLGGGGEGFAPLRLHQRRHEGVLLP